MFGAWKWKTALLKPLKSVKLSSFAKPFAGAERKFEKYRLYSFSQG